VIIEEAVAEGDFDILVRHEANPSSDF
jgi:hypothetical protein